MSILDVVAARVADGMLFPLVPRAAGTAPKRAMLVAEDLWTFLHESDADPEWEDRKGFLEADLEVFAEGQRIGPRYLFLLYPLAREFGRFVAGVQTLRYVSWADSLGRTFLLPPIMRGETI
jgi:hypothetical protein